MKRGAPKDTAPGTIELIEEAVHLLRGVSPGGWVIYGSGAVPWLLGLCWFWASASWFGPSGAELVWGALGLTVLFLGLKTAQAAFCAGLRARRMGADAVSLTGGMLAGIAGRQTRLQGWSMAALPVAAVLTVPAGFVWSFFENATALAASGDARGESLARRAAREARRWPATTHLSLLVFSGLWLAVWLNVASAFYVVPWLARTLLGVENVFGLAGWDAFNSSFVALTVALTWLLVDPLVKAYHVLLTFYGEARATGEDLRLEIVPRVGRGRAGKRVAGAAAIALLLGLCAPGGVELQAQEAPPSPAAVDAAELDAALDLALSGRDFQWKLEPLPRAAPGAGEEGAVKSFVRAGVELVVQALRDVQQAIKRFERWLRRLFGEERETPEARTPREAGDFSALLRVLLYGALGLCLVALVWMILVGWKRRRPPVAVFGPAMAAVLPPDLNDERLEASRLPVDEWLELARGQMARGEWRLALRALYLATLAQLGTEGLITLARAKTNLDYERELLRRAVGRVEVARAFRERRLDFESAWYGRRPAGEPEATAWLRELESARARQGGSS
jgi:hypothetical protein